MRYRLTCAVEGSLFLNDSLTTTYDFEGVRYELIADETRHVTKAAVSLEVPPTKRSEVGTSLEPPVGSRFKTVIHIRTDKELHDTLVDALQRLESLLALSPTGPRVRRVRWDVVSREWIAESEEDRAAAPVSSIEFGYAPKTIRSTLTSNSFAIMIANADRYESLRTLSAFYRQGVGDLQDGQFVQAIYNFYFIIEDLFANGRSAEKEVLKAFESEQELEESLRITLEEYPNHSGRHMEALRAIMAEERLSWTLPDLMRFVVRIRNRVHHYSGKSTKRQATPFAQGDFHSVALLLLHLVSLVLYRQVIALNGRSGAPKGPPPERS